MRSLSIVISLLSFPVSLCFYSERSKHFVVNALHSYYKVFDIDYDLVYAAFISLSSFVVLRLVL